MSSYATITDATNFGLVPGSYGLNITVQQIQANLDAASDEADDFMGARYSMPLLPPLPLSIVRGVVHIARYHIIALRGFDEKNPSDVNVVKMYEAARKFFADVRNQSLHPCVVESPPPTNLGQPQYAAPLIVSQPLQGWIPSEGGCGNGGNPYPNGGFTPSPSANNWWPGCGWPPPSGIV